MTAPDRNNKFYFELYLIKKTYQLFGFKKMVMFLIGLPTVIFTKRNRSAYNFLGKCVMEINDKKIKWKHTDVGFIDELILDKCYMPNDSFKIKNDYVVVDAGANVGVFSLFAASYAINGKIISIEADKYDYKRLQDNISENNFKNIFPINKALTDKSGHVYLSDSVVREPSNKNFHKDNYIFEGKVESISPDDLIKEFKLNRIDFLKLDIEGSEFKIFSNPNWLKIVRIISMELHAEPEDKKTLEMKKMLENFNFSVNLIKNGNVTYCFALKHQ